jgi:hypothetical protein
MRAPKRQQKTKNDSQNPQTALKGGKIMAGDTLQLSEFQRNYFAGLQLHRSNHTMTQTNYSKGAKQIHV